MLSMPAVSSLVLLLCGATTARRTVHPTDHAAQPLDASMQGSKPNIVFILADDLGWGNIGHHNGVTQSPYIDQLFTHGLTLNHSYSHKW